MQYGKVERQIAKFLEKYPKIKAIVKRGYQHLNYFGHKKDYKYKSIYPIHPIEMDKKESFFGYYDKSPINETNEYIIFHSSNIFTKNLPNPKIAVDIVVFDVKNNKYQKIDESFAYNWQQGSRLVWLNKYEFIYNVFENGKYKSKVYDIKSNTFKIIDFPVYDVYKDIFAISLNFERLNLWRKDYGYTNLNVKFNNEDNANDGLYYCDLSENKKTLIVSIDEIINQNYKPTMDNAQHKFNHVMISPNGERIMFMHRWLAADDIKYDTLYVYDLIDKNITKVADDGMVSHCFWYDDNNIFAYLRDKELGDNYYMIDINSTKKMLIGDGIINIFGDGHPNCHNQNIIFDTYPDKSRMKHLYLYNIQNNDLVELGEFFEPFDYSRESRCDLHPRFSFDSKKVFFDSTHTGDRKLYMMELE